MDAVRLSTYEDAASLAPRLRPADVQELLAAGSTSALEALNDGVRYSQPCLSIVDMEDTVVTMFGVTPSGNPDVGFAWLLSSDALDKHKIKFLRQSKVWLEYLHSRHPLLTNYVDARNVVHIAWLRWLGFRFLREVQMGSGNHTFYEFARIHHV
jgi:hypothetical protein